ncbi:hypothetical protein GHT06_004425 [Daphnia sinensis]|uniref:CCHC-type domain-containing protein n=1 Tax=Daphnia sinensis TaxID=1820382 RepID=A0AAD5L425_9CRUS|nr:hypothetical protein GHT06_004425 [Daphnia sinensis]
MEVDSQLRARRQGPCEPVMTYCYDVHILPGLNTSLMAKVMLDLTQPFTVDQLFARIQVHLLHTDTLHPPSAGFVTKEELSASIASLRKEVKEDVSSTLSFTVAIKDTIRSELKGSKTNDRVSARKDGVGLGNRVFKRTVDGRPICNSCGHPGHIARTCIFTPTRPPLACFICGQVGHISRQCPSRLGGTSRQGLLDAGFSGGYQHFKSS